MATKIVIGLGYGDEGKGLVTDWLCSKEADRGLVIRFNGGHQAGHTVYREDGTHHTFSSFGSGTFQKFATYISKYCTIYPPALMTEHGILMNDHKIHPYLMIDSLCMVTTPYDICYNQTMEEYRHVHQKHGSVGVGFGATIERHETSPYKLFAVDLYNDHILSQKLKWIKDYYDKKIKEHNSVELNNLYLSKVTDENRFIDDFKTYCKNVTRQFNIEAEKKVIKRFLTAPVIFEGAQGIMLDMDHGCFPHVTRSNTTCKNAIELIKRNSLPDPSIYYVTRAYQTRHGAGPMTNESHTQNHLILDNPQEHNQEDEWQGNFRKSLLDLETLNHAYLIDNSYFRGGQRNLVITCLDHFENEKIWVTHSVSDGGEKIAIPVTPDQIRRNMSVGNGIRGLYTSNSPYGKNIDSNIKEKIPVVS